MTITRKNSGDGEVGEIATSGRNAALLQLRAFLKRIATDSIFDHPPLDVSGSLRLGTAYRGERIDGERYFSSF